MPTVKGAVEIDISVYCGICGHGCCNYTKVDRYGSELTINCPKCKEKIQSLESEIEMLMDRLSEVSR